MEANARTAPARVSILRALLVATLGLLALTLGCSPAGGAAEETWSSLAPGSEVQGPAGVRLSSPDGVTDSPVDVKLEFVEQPELEIDEDVDPVGEPVSVLARDRTAALSSRGFVLSVPIPAGTQLDGAGVAVHLAGGEVANHDDTGRRLDEPFWELIEFDLDESGTAASVELAVLSDNEIIVQIVNGADFVEVDLPSAQGHGDGFVTVCRRKHQDICLEHGADARAAFAAAHARFSAMGFFEPFLRTNWRGAYKVNLRPYRLESGSGTCKVDSELSGRTGRYILPLKKVVVCVGGGPFAGVDEDTGWTAGRTRTAAHELFHAVQYAHLSFRRRPMQMWSVEGTANLSEASTATQLVRDWSDPRPVDVPLDLNFILNPGAADSNQYRTQDFFAFLGDVIAPGQGLSYLFDVFLEGPTPPEVSEAIEGFGHPALTDLSDAYWAWARNQTFEKTVLSATRGTDAHPAGDACELLATVASPHPIFMLDGVTPASYSETLPPLTSKVLEIVVEAAGDLDVEMVYHVQAEGPEVRSALYDPKDCLQPDTPALGLFQVPAGTTETRYLLVSNTEFRQGRTRDFTFEISYGQVEPAVRIVEPEDGATIGEDQTFTLRAEGVDGTLPADALLHWTYTRNGGVPFTIATRPAGMPVDVPTLCDGEYVFSVLVLDGPEAFVGASDEVAATVEDIVPRPAACAWTVEIVQPTSGAKIPTGEAAAFRATFEDDHPDTDDPLDTITWYRKDHFGGLIWNQFGIGPQTTGTFAAGYWDVRAVYGDAVDTILVHADAGAAPNVTITAPQEGDTYRWDEHLPGPRVEIPLEVTALDPEDGPLAGDAVQWQVRQPNISAWTDHATGTSASYTSNFYSEWVEFRVIATDSDGFETISDDVRVVFVQPID